MNLSERFLDEAEGYGRGPLTLHDVDIKHLQWLLREAAALAKRYEDAPTGFVVGQAGNVPTLEAAIVHMDDPSKIKGQRVQLVVEGGGD